MSKEKECTRSSQTWSGCLKPNCLQVLVEVRVWALLPPPFAPFVYSTLRFSVLILHLRPTTLRATTFGFFHPRFYGRKGLGRLGFWFFLQEILLAHKFLNLGRGIWVFGGGGGGKFTSTGAGMFREELPPPLQLIDWPRGWCLWSSGLCILLNPCSWPHSWTGRIEMGFTQSSKMLQKITHNDLNQGERICFELLFGSTGRIILFFIMT